MLFFWNFLFRVGWERNEMIIFIISLSQPFPTDYGLKRSQNGIFLIFRIFQLFFLNFKLCVWTERIGTIIFFSLFLGLPQSILDWKEVIMYILNFLNFVTIFLEFSITRRVGTERQFLFSLFICLAQPILAWNEAITIFFNFLNLSAILLEFSITRRVGTKRNNNFYFLSASTFSNLFWLEMKPYGYLLLLRILLLFFWNFQLWVGWIGTDRNNNFHYLSFSAFSNVFWIEKKR